MKIMQISEHILIVFNLSQYNKIVPDFVRRVKKKFHLGSVVIGSLFEQIFMPMYNIPIAETKRRQLYKKAYIWQTLSLPPRRTLVSLSIGRYLVIMRHQPKLLNCGVNCKK